MRPVWMAVLSGASERAPCLQPVLLSSFCPMLSRTSFPVECCSLSGALCHRSQARCLAWQRSRTAPQQLGRSRQSRSLCSWRALLAGRLRLQTSPALQRAAAQARWRALQQQQILAWHAVPPARRRTCRSASCAAASASAQQPATAAGPSTALPQNTARLATAVLALMWWPASSLALRACAAQLVANTRGAEGSEAARPVRPFRQLTIGSQLPSVKGVHERGAMQELARTSPHNGPLYQGEVASVRTRTCYCFVRPSPHQEAL